MVGATFKHGKIVITPKLVVDRSAFPDASGEYTPAQRRFVDKGIAKSEEEYGQGVSFGPFATHNEFIASLHQQTGKVATKKSKRPNR